MKPWESGDPDWNKPVGKNRNRIEVLVWMLRNGITATQLAKEVGSARPSLATNTIAGRRNSRKILRLLLDKGCPADILDLPKDMREVA